jgi:hypothetical protein
MHVASEKNKKTFSNAFKQALIAAGRVKWHWRNSVIWKSTLKDTAAVEKPWSDMVTLVASAHLPPRHQEDALDQWKLWMNHPLIICTRWICIYGHLKMWGTTRGWQSWTCLHVPRDSLASHMPVRREEGNWPCCQPEDCLSIWEILYLKWVPTD